MFDYQTDKQFHLFAVQTMTQWLHWTGFIDINSLFCFIFRCINKSKEKEGKTSTTIQISYWDQLVHEEKYTLIKVGNRDTIHQTIKSALEDLKLCDGEDQLKPCDPSEYQLWVKTSKDDTPYPLIGHEYPFSIKMNFVRDLLYR